MVWALGWLFFFGTSWVAFALWARRRNFGGVIAWGGGFIVGCLALIPLGLLAMKYDNWKQNQTVQHAPATPGAVASVIQGEGLGVSHDLLLAALGPYAPHLKPAPTTPDGRTRLLGQTQGGSAAILEISGKALSQAVEKATLNVAATQDDKQNGVNALLLGRYLDALFPEWPDRAGWAVNAIQAGSKESIEVAGKRITFTPLDVAGTKMLVFTAEAI